MFTKAKLIAEGKTKRLHAVEEDPALVIVENKNDVTAFDDPKYTRRFGTKAKCATLTTSSMFTLLRNAGIAVAFREQLSETEFLAEQCTMIPLEVVCRRYADGSYLLRYPHLGVQCTRTRFHRLEYELFLKTTGGKCGELQFGIDPLDPNGTKHIEDPLIANPSGISWVFVHSKLPLWDKRADLLMHLECQVLVPNWQTCGPEIERMARRSFHVLEHAWAQLGYRLIDCKFELGIDHTGVLRIADVVDSDSWRLRTGNWEDVSKQSFRDGSPLSEVAEKYARVAMLSQQLRVPSQAIVYWRASEKDPKPDGVIALPGVDVRDIVCSAHRQPQRSLRLLQEVQQDFLAGGVIIAVVGKSNGLGPMLAAQTSWPVIAVCASAREFPDDVWSSLRMPTDVPLTVCGDPMNAYLAALNILSVSNPAAYAERQLRIESLDQ